MATYTVRAPDGKLYDLEAPKGLSRASIRSLALAHLGTMEMPDFAPSAPVEPQGESGFIAATKAGASNVYEDLATLAGKTGLISPEKAEQIRAEQEAYQKRTFKPTEEWGLTKGLELLGGSLPYMVAPAAAAAAAPAGIATLGAAGAASALQFTGSNLSRQIQEGKRLSETDFGNALLASVPQAAFDTISMRMIPGLGKLLGSVGEKMTEAQAKQILERKLKDTVVDYSLKTGKTAGVEGLTEAGQQVFERLQAGLNITDEAARKEYLDNFIGGAVLGGALSVPGRFVERAQERAQAEDLTLGEQTQPPAEDEFKKVLAGQETTTPAAPAAPSIRTEEDALGPLYALRDSTEKRLGEAVAKGQKGTFVKSAERRLAELNMLIGIGKGEATPDVVAKAQGHFEKLNNELVALTEEYQATVDQKKMPPADLLRRIEMKQEQIRRYGIALGNLKTAEGATDVGQTDVTAGGAGADVSQPAGATVPAPGGAKPSTAAGVVPAGENVAVAPVGKGEQSITVNQLAREEQKRAGWNEAWPFVPADLGNKDFRDLIRNDPNLTYKEKQQIFQAGYKLGVVPEGEQPAPVVGTTGTEVLEDVPDLAAKPAESTPPAPTEETPARTSDQVMDEIRAVEQQQQALLSKSGRMPNTGTEKYNQWAALEAQRINLRSEWNALDKQERTAKKAAPQITQDTIDEFDASRDFYNEQADNAKRQIPAFSELTPEQQARVAEMTKDGSAESYDAAAATIADELHGRPEPKVKEAELPNQIKKQVENGNLLAAINYLKSSKNVSPILREVAKRIGQLKLNTKLEFVASLPNGRVAEYDPKADVIRMTEAGKTERNLLHELVHAASVRILSDSDKAQNKLTDSQEDAAAHLKHLMEITKDKLGERFPDAYKNVYEFLSEAMTNDEFQSELNKIAIPRNESLVPGEVSAWKNFVRTIANLLGIDVAKFQQGTSALLEAFQAFDNVVSVPKGGIEMEPLGTTVAAPVMPAQSAEQRRAGYKKQVEIKERGAKSLVKNLWSFDGYNLIVRKFANSREGIRRVQQTNDRLGLIERIGPKLNNVYDQLTFSIGRGVNLFNSRLRYLTQDLEGKIGAYAEKRGITVKEALGELHLVFEARHEPERRMVKYLFTVPLDDLRQIYQLESVMGEAYKGKKFSAEGVRHEIKNILAEDKKLDAKTLQALRGALETVVADAKADPTLRPPKATDATYDVNNANYSVIGDGVSAEGRSADEIADISKQFDRPELKSEIDAVEASMKKVIDETKDLNKMANYWSKPVENISEFYGYKHYVPFKGRKGQRTIDEQLDIGSRLIGGEFQDMANAFEGRKSESENPVLQVLADASSSALRAGRSDLTLAIKNAVESGILRGEIKYIDFRDRYVDNVEKADLAGPGKIFHYEPDGRIAVVNISDAAQAEAIRRTYRTANPIIDTIDRYTSLMGQTHTRYNPAFGPVNFVTDMLTNAWNLGAKYGPAKSFQLIRQITDDIVFNGGIAKSAKFAYAMEKGNTAELNRLAGGAKPYDQLTKGEQYFRDLKEYVDMGGKVSYLQAVSARGAEEQLSRDLNRGKGTRAKEFVDSYVDMYNDTLELASRVGSYRTLRSQYFAENKKSGRFKSDADALADAKVKAAAEAKNLANFEQTGEWGKTAGALFMFFRPAATGAYRAIEAVMPALRLYGFTGTLLPGKGVIKEREEMFRAAHRQMLANRKEKLSDAEINKRTEEALKQYKREAENARHMIMGLIGFGMAMYYMSYMMSGDDEEGRNKVATDDMARWTRNMRFFTPFSDNPVQVRWGFGHGAFAAIGAQIAALTMGRDPASAIFDNIRQVLMDNYLPLPISKINMFEKPLPFIADTLNPSLTRPLFEFVMNLDGLGRSIYNDRQSRYGDAYMGSDSTPGIYKDAARTLFDITNGSVDMNPNTMMFLASNYIDGMAQIASAGHGLFQAMSGKKDFDVRNEMPFLRGFVGAPSNIDAREFARVEDRIKTIEKKLNTMKESRPDMYDEYVDAHPDEADIVKYYNTQINRNLRKVRQQLNDVRAMPGDEITPRERKQEIDELMKYQNAIKRDLLLTFKEDFGFKP